MPFFPKSSGSLPLLRPGHGRAALSLGLILRFLSAFEFVALASLGGRDQSAMLAVGGTKSRRFRRTRHGNG